MYVGGTSGQSLVGWKQPILSVLHIHVANLKVDVQGYLIAS